MTDEERRMFSNRLREAHAEIERLRALVKMQNETLEDYAARILRLEAADEEPTDVVS